MAIEAAYCEDSPLVDLEDPRSANGPSMNCAVPGEWVSPLTCQWLDVTTTTHIGSRMLLLAGLMHRWLATFPTRYSRGLPAPTHELSEERVSLRQKIENSAPAPIGSNAEAEAMYECCQWASLTLLVVEKLSIPIYVAAQHIRIYPKLIKHLRMTDLSDLWGIRKGLLFWVISVCHFSIAGHCFPLMSTTLFARFAQGIAMSDRCSETAIEPPRRLKHFENLCCGLESAPTTYTGVS